ncbi:MAG TPA: hypothetical protein VGK90_04890 [Rhizomicrobium sp.]|jgi:hypothetical protein
MITKRPWFGPKRFGWGWTPVSWEGWFVTVLSMAVVIAAIIVFSASPMTVYISVATVAALIVICLLTGAGPG